MRTIYEISAELDTARDEAFQYAAQNEGELPEYVNAVLESLEGDREEVIEQIACLYKEVVGFSGQIKEEQARLKKLKSRHDSDAEQIKGFLADYLTAGEKLKTPKVTVSWSKSSSTVLNEGVDVEDIDSKYQNIKITVAKTALGKAIKAGDIDAIKVGSIVSNTKVTIK